MIAINGRFLTQRLTGVQRFAAELSKRLVDSDPSIRCVTPRQISDPSTARALKVERWGHLRGHAWEQLELPAWTAMNRPRVLLNLGNTGPLAVKRQIVVIHDAAVLRYPGWYSRSFRTAYQLLLPRIGRRALQVITVSEFSKRELMDLLGLRGDQISVVPGAVSPPPPRALVDRENLILAVSSIAKHKNLARLIAAFERSGLSSHRLVVVGGTAAHFRNHGLAVRAESNIEFRGYVTDEDLEDLYSRAQMFVFPSLYEGFGLPPLEAMARGCATVVANAASIPEVCGDAALYCDPHDEQSIAVAMHRVATDASLRTQLQTRGLARSRQFSWENSASLFRAVIEKYA